MTLRYKNYAPTKKQMSTETHDELLSLIENDVIKQNAFLAKVILAATIRYLATYKDLQPGFSKFPFLLCINYL